MTTTRTQRPVVRRSFQGSWEDVLNQANRLAALHNDDAIPLFRKVIDRLADMPVRRREAGNGYLQGILTGAGTSLQQYLAAHRRYAEVAEISQQMSDLVLDEEERFSWRFDAGKGYFLAGDTGRAFEIWRATAEETVANVLSWGYIVSRYMDVDRWDDAWATADEMTKYIEVDGDPDDVIFDRAFVVGVRSEIAARQQRWDEAVRWAQEAASLDPEQTHYFSTIYIALIWAGEYAKALEVLEHEPMPIRAALWRGLCLQKLGQETTARRTWEKVARLDGAKMDAPEVVDWTVVQYYLDDPQGHGLSAILRMAREHHFVHILTLVALGWAIRDNMENALASLAHALNHQRALLLDDLLTDRSWHLFRDLLDEDAFEQVRGFFMEPTA